MLNAPTYSCGTQARGFPFSGLRPSGTRIVQGKISQSAAVAPEVRPADEGDYDLGGDTGTVMRGPS